MLSNDGLQENDILQLPFTLSTLTCSSGSSDYPVPLVTLCRKPCNRPYTVYGSYKHFLDYKDLTWKYKIISRGIYFPVIRHNVTLYIGKRFIDRLRRQKLINNFKRNPYIIILRSKWLRRIRYITFTFNDNYSNSKFFKVI